MYVCACMYVTVSAVADRQIYQYTSIHIPYLVVKGLTILSLRNPKYFPHNPSTSSL